ncbi:hypothetical protein ABW20_dc0103969 [Dactylellina cionopaga]|nr:hypothetical protein ABW20_dc0103969 [Dactylellina cionopaga]
MNATTTIQSSAETLDSQPLELKPKLSFARFAFMDTAAVLVVDNKVLKTANDNAEPEPFSLKDPVWASWWADVKSDVDWTWVGPAMYVYPVFRDGRWWTPWGSPTLAPFENWIVWKTKIQWPPATATGTGRAKTQRPKTTPVVKTSTGVATIQTTVNGQSTAILSSFTSLVTEPPIVPSISTAVETSSFLTTINGKPTQTSVLITHAWAIGPSSTITSTGVSFIPTVIDGTTTSVAKPFTTTFTTAGETYALFGGVTTTSTAFDGTTAIVTLTLIAGSLVPPKTTGTSPVTAAQEFKTIIENGDGVTYLVTNGVTKTLAVSGSLIVSSAFPTQTIGEAVRSGLETPGTFSTQVASRAGGNGGGQGTEPTDSRSATGFGGGYTTPTITPPEESGNDKTIKDGYHLLFFAFIGVTGVMFCFF